MTNKEKIKILFKKKAQKLLKYNEAYFEKDSPIVTDHQFDQL
jgi:NAD-dependent DNA ligase